MKIPTITITKRNVRSKNLFEAHLNKAAIELINSDKILFSYNSGALKLRIPSYDDKNAYTISKHKQTYKKKVYNSSAKFSPVIMNSPNVEGKYTLAKHGQSFILRKI